MGTSGGAVGVYIESCIDEPHTKGWITWMINNYSIQVELNKSIYDLN